MNDTWTQLGVGGIFCILILRMVFEFVKDKRGNGGSVFSMVKDLHQWHAPDDAGEQTWKNSRMLKLMESYQELQREHHALMREHHTLMKRLLPTLEKLTAGARA